MRKLWHGSESSCERGTSTPTQVLGSPSGPAGGLVMLLPQQTCGATICGDQVNREGLKILSDGLSERLQGERACWVKGADCGGSNRHNLVVHSGVAGVQQHPKGNRVSTKNPCRGHPCGLGQSAKERGKRCLTQKP